VVYNVFSKVTENKRELRGGIGKINVAPTLRSGFIPPWQYSSTARPRPLRTCRPELQTLQAQTIGSSSLITCYIESVVSIQLDFFPRFFGFNTSVITTVFFLLSGDLQTTDSGRVHVVHLCWKPAILTIDARLLPRIALSAAGKWAAMSIDAFSIRTFATMNAGRHTCHKLQSRELLGVALV
jgi:hypothetical protein